ncbi:MAG: hypothetical protein LC135_09765 [Phycisphaerae bacterium]|nr:hypothetical protein [Phycisphaerae bacterium]MCZ2400136.1 hypothetical protein [Phycisphaerae bacterium]NUQ47310.1 hypothetical protein [Phycisphaerae bacterium]
MTSIFEITDWAHVASFFVWTLAVCAIAKALFGSLPAAELQYRLSLRDAPRRQRMNRLNWEINNRAKWGEDVARRSPHAAKQPLTDADIESRRLELQQLARSSLTWRAFTYFMGCFACQASWTALAVFAFTRGVGESLAASALRGVVFGRSGADWRASFAERAPLARGRAHTSLQGLSERLNA